MLTSLCASVLLVFWRRLSLLVSNARVHIMIDNALKMTLAFRFCLRLILILLVLLQRLLPSVTSTTTLRNKRAAAHMVM